MIILWPKTTYFRYLGQTNVLHVLVVVVVYALIGAFVVVYALLGVLCMPARARNNHSLPEWRHRASRPQG